MKVNHPQIPTFLFALGIIFLMFSCEKTEELLPQQDTAVLQEGAQVNAAFDEADFFTLSAMQSNGLGLRTNMNIQSDFCADTKVDFFPNNKAIVINFGAGCKSPKGITRKGKIMIYYSALSFDSGSEITIAFDGYEVNGLKIEGRRKIIQKGFNAEGKYFMFQTVIVAGKVTWPDGTYATIEGEHDKKLFLPTDSNGIKLEVTGGSGGITRLGIPFMSLIEEKLVFIQSCTDKGNWVPSSGKLELTVNTDSKFLIDYGNGECDKIASVTHNGKTVSVKFD
ncbi:hypothetical protein MMU07_11200 [Aquiflexum sp. LQ15W]|jgi:hypothetical protein|uniref:hypothetical protein n=1 Tax=Cognataquiflexum nitidum TaxID=2922272 RepID=UPI001F134CCF|nr:hypothetical protein [Cognataquiflexum nitidum]MCH6200152.1 hypothetical protein [Cognataquiflexum nitidum]